MLFSGYTSLYDGTGGDWIFNPADDILFQDGSGTNTLAWDNGNNEWVLSSPFELQINSGAFINFITSASSASAGVQTLPSNPAGFIRVKIAGVERSIPFYPV